MCEEAKLQEWAKGVTSRRDLGLMTGAVMLVACAPADLGESDGASQAAAAMGTSESAVTFDTADGVMDAFFVHPDDGRHPGCPAAAR